MHGVPVSGTPPEHAHFQHLSSLAIDRIYSKNINTKVTLPSPIPNDKGMHGM